jgi:hypothetical protein
MKMNKLVKFSTMVAVVTIMFGGYASSIYGQETSTTDGAAQASPGPLTITQCGSECNATKGYEIEGRIVLATSGTLIDANTALGYDALVSNTGTFNTASGYEALHLNTTGTSNTAIGSVALYTNSTGSGNTASGDAALSSNETGSFNTASGASALVLNLTGSNNVAFGANACLNLLAGSNVICIGSGSGPAADIAGPATYIAGIYGAATTGSDNPLVCVDSTGLLGTTNCATRGAAQQEVILLQQQIQTQAQQIADLQWHLAQLEALLAKN